MKMERNFMGLAQNKVKEQVIDVCDDPASAIQWSFANQVSSHSSSPSQERPRKTGYDSLTSAGYMTISTSEASHQKPYSNKMQRNLSLEKKTGGHYPVANYPCQQFDAHAAPHEARLFPNANRTNQIVHASMSNPVHHSIITSAGSNVIVSPVNVQPVEDVPNVATTVVGPCSTSVVGNTDLRNVTNSPKAPAQLTIFYSGLVCVYDNVSPEKAQAIMLLAGNTPPSMTPMPSMTPKAAAPAPSQIQSTGLCRSTNEIAASKSIGFSISPAVPEPLRVIRSFRPVPAIQPILDSSDVPQARKASLARFLEKRKERAMCAAPYNNTQSTNSSALGQGSKSISINSERPRNHLDMRHRLDSKGQRKGKVIDYRVSELRVVELLDGLCEKMQDYTLNKINTATQAWMKVDDWDNLPFNKQEARAYSKDISSYCGRLLEETEDELAEMIKKGSVKVGDVSKLLCEDLSRHCNKTSSQTAGKEDGDEADGEL